MKVYKYNVNGTELVIKLADAGRTIGSITFGGQNLTVPAEEMERYAAVIALSLIHYEVDDIHDEESGIITFDAAETQWNNPVQSLNSVG